VTSLVKFFVVVRGKNFLELLFGEKKMKNTIILAVLVACSLLITCANPMSGEDGVIGNGGGVITVTIGDVNARKIVKWADALDSSELTYTITFSGGQGGPHSATIPPGGGTATFSVTPGEWTISVEARYQDEIVAIGSQKKQINQGNNGSVSIMMGEPDAPFPEFTVDFESNGGTAVASKTVKKFNKVPKPAPDPTNGSMYFVDWFTDNPPTVHYDFNAPVTADMTLFAEWSSTVPLIITFDKNHNDPSGWTDANPPSKNALLGETVTLPAPPTRSGYTFNGWNTNADGTGTAIISSIHVTASITLYAQWKVAQGDGTSGNPFFVYTVADLSHVGNPSIGTDYEDWTLDKHYIQMKDINLSGISNWTPIGVFASSPFEGSYDGNDYTISNLKINRSGDSYQGMFGRTGSTAVVKNVVLVNCSITGSSYPGGVVGGNNGGTVLNCSVSGSVSGTGNVGGVVGINNDGTVQNCSFSGPVSGTTYVGGVVGQNSEGVVEGCHATGNVSGTQRIGGVVGYNDGTVQNCYYDAGTVSGTNALSQYIGGVVGYNFDGTVENCHAAGNVTGILNNVGGVVGYTNGGVVEGCYATGAVSGTGASSQYIGGVVGQITNNGMVKNCHATGTVEGTGASSQNIGGVVGYNTGGTVQGCDYNTGAVRGTGASSQYIGGVVGQNINNGKVLDCHASGIVSGNQNVGGVVGYNTGSGSTVQGCYYTTGTVSGTGSSSQYIGGVVGGNAASGMVNSCHSTGNVSGNQYIGGVVGYNTGSGSTVQGCYIDTGTVEGTGNYVGGVVGSNAASGKVLDCHIATGTVKGTGSNSQFIGGVVGYNTGSGSTVQGCYYTTATFSGYTNIGGVVGGNAVSGMVQYCYATGDVTGSNYVGGVVGGNGSTNPSVSGGTVQYCYSTGNVSGGYLVGGVLGNITDGTLKDCYATGDVEGTGQCIGGVVGYNMRGTVQNCYATGNVSGSARTGGVVGQSDGAGAGGSGTTRDCVALNTDIASGDVWRVTDRNTPTMSNNYGRSDTKKNGTPGVWNYAGVNREDGADITAAQWEVSGWWTSTANFGSAWDCSGVSATSLPKLVGVGGTQNPVVH
jgi:uncharacterized repeat protein (TIGR02543 family)